MVVALLFRIGEGLAAAAVHALGGHGGVFVVVSPLILLCSSVFGRDRNGGEMIKTGSTNYVSRAVSGGRTRGRADWERRPGTLSSPGDD